MFNHAPHDYDCPFCRVARDEFTDSKPLTRPEDVILRTQLATAFICLGGSTKNVGHVLVIPNRHFENIYDLPLEYATEIHCLSKAVALGMKAVYGCSGTSTRQHNEPDGNQDVWHYHMHVFPRYKNDFLYWRAPFGRTTPASKRAELAQKLRTYLEQHSEAL